MSTDSRLIVAADGVGGWGELDVDPGLFSKHLCRTIGKIYDKGGLSGLKELLVSAVKENPHTGSTTAVMAKVSEGGNMETCNLGDSGYLLLRFDDSGALETKYQS